MKAKPSEINHHDGEVSTSSSHRHALTRFDKRLCVTCRTYQPKALLHAVTVSSSQQWSINQNPLINGRSAYCCKGSDCLAQALRQRRFARSLKRGIPDGIVEDLNQIAMLVSTAQLFSVNS